MPKPRLLDLFCCAGGAAMGYHRAGFEVVGVDIKPQPHYPFEFHQGDALTYPLDGFDAYHASPPCQDYSVTKTLLQGNEYPRLIVPVTQRFKESNRPYVVENVVGSEIPPQRTLDGINGVLLCGTSFGMNIKRHRLFETSFPVPTLEHNHSLPIIDIYGDKPRLARMREIFPQSIGADLEVFWKNHIGVTWMKHRDEWREAIPPAYTEYIGKYLMAEVTKQTSGKNDAQKTAGIE